LPSVAAPR